MAREMKDSGLKWLGNIPKSWKLLRIGAQYVERRTKVSDTDYPPLSVTMKGILPQLSTAAKTDAHDDRKLVCKGDFAINSRSDRRGSCGISPYDGSVSLINTVLTPRDKMNPQYYDWLFHCSMFSDEYYSWGHGIVDDLWTTNWQDMKKISIPEPPLPDQHRIATFLDRKCAEIDSVIADTQKTIEEYKVLKQSIITEAVTKGVRGERKMKDSGVEWIGKIADGFQLTKLKYLCTILDQYRSPIAADQRSQKGEILYDYYGASGVIDKIDGYTIDDHVMLIGEDGANLRMRNLPLMYEVNGKAWINNHAHILKPTEKTDFYFLFFALECIDINVYITGSAQPKLSQDNLKQIWVPTPSYSEQREIAAYIREKCTAIDTLIAAKQQLLTELESYKKSVIYEYVTGKKECDIAIAQITQAAIVPFYPAAISTTKVRFAQAVLMAKVLDKRHKGMGRVKLEKTMYTIETIIGFDFETEYVRQVAGPLDESLYKCEGIISRVNHWYTVCASQHGVSYKPTKNADKYQSYYCRYFRNYNTEIERIIDIFASYTTEQAEVIATLLAAWNDAIIEGKSFTDTDIVNDVLNNWSEEKKRFSKDVWLRAMDELRKKDLIPKGYGKKTVRRNIK